MNLITILISLALEKYVENLEQYRNFNWFEKFTDWVRSTSESSMGGTMAAALCVIPVTLLVGLISTQLGTLLGLVFAVAILSYSFGPKHLIKQSDAFLEAVERGDIEGAALHSNELLDGSQAPQNEPLVLSTTKAVLVQANERVFAVLFWFVVLGPMGAILFRLASMLRHTSSEKQDEHPDFVNAAYRLHYILNWIPTRLTLLSYALSGSLVDTLNNWRNYDSDDITKWADRNTGMLAYGGMGALQLETKRSCDIEENSDEIRIAISLALRALIIWVSIIAVMTITGWAT